jgi:hypothetical protein
MKYLSLGYGTKGIEPVSGKIYCLALVQCDVSDIQLYAAVIRNGA